MLNQKTYKLKTYKYECAKITPRKHYACPALSRKWWRFGWIQIHNTELNCSKTDTLVFCALFCLQNLLQNKRKQLCYQSWAQICKATTNSKKLVPFTCLLFGYSCSAWDPVTAVCTVPSAPYHTSPRKQQCVLSVLNASRSYRVFSMWTV